MVSVCVLQKYSATDTNSDFPTWGLGFNGLFLQCMSLNTIALTGKVSVLHKPCFVWFQD